MIVVVEQGIKGVVVAFLGLVVHLALPGPDMLLSLIHHSNSKHSRLKSGPKVELFKEECCPRRAPRTSELPGLPDPLK